MGEEVGTAMSTSSIQRFSTSLHHYSKRIAVKGQSAMHVSMRGQEALRNLREDLEEDAGEDFPSDVMTELLVLYDVGKALDLNYFEIEHILGEEGLQAVNQHLRTTVDIEDE